MSSLPKPLGQPWVAIIVSRFLVPALVIWFLIRGSLRESLETIGLGAE